MTLGSESLIVIRCPGGSLNWQPGYSQVNLNVACSVLSLQPAKLLTNCRVNQAFFGEFGPIPGLAKPVFRLETHM